MAHTVTITFDSTTLTLTLVDYTPTSASASQPTVTEKWEVYLSAATKALLQTEIENINRAFERARRHQYDPMIDRVYLNFQPSGYAASQRSEILDGEIQYYNETLKYGWANTAFDVKLVITRRNYWEGALTAIPLTNSNGTDDTSGLNVYNCNDGDGSSPNKRENYADIDADDLDGDLPAPVKISLASGGSCIQDPILALFNSGDLSSMSHVEECEDATGVGTGADSGCSYGYYGYGSGTGVNTALNIFCFEINSYWASLEVGRWYLPILKLKSVPTIADLWTRVMIDCGMEVATQWITYPASGGPSFIQFPPVRLAMKNLGVMIGGLSVQFKTSTIGAKTIYGDFIYMLPLDGLRSYHDLELNGSRGEDELVDNPYDDIVYKIDVVTGGGKHELVQTKGNILMLDPQFDSRLYFLSTSGASGISVSAVLKAWYRPRRLAL